MFDLAQVAIASNAFELSQLGKEKVGMHSVSLNAFLNELVKISASKEKIANGLTNAFSKTVASPLRTVAKTTAAVTKAAPVTNAVAKVAPAVRAEASALKGLPPRPIPRDVQHSGVHTQAPASAPAKKPAGGSNLRRTLAIGGGALTAGMLAGHAMPHHQQQQ